MTPRIPENISTWLVDSWRMCRRETPTTLMRTKKTKRRGPARRASKIGHSQIGPRYGRAGVPVVKQANEAIEHHEVEIGALLSRRRREREYERAL
jgi:hypothetical protein